MKAGIVFVLGVGVLAGWGSLALAAEASRCAGPIDPFLAECVHQNREAAKLPPYPDGRRVGTCEVPVPGASREAFLRYADCLERLKAEERRLVLEKILDDIREAEARHKARLEAERLQAAMELAASARRQGAGPRAASGPLACRTTRAHGVPVTTCE
ncbi:MAG TPA: hypothetical protein VIG69_08435 [Candidatus Methylomirabilis sp.]|jgi:hypothetical protein